MVEKESMFLAGNLCLFAKHLSDQTFIKDVGIQGFWLYVLISVALSLFTKPQSFYFMFYTQELRFLSPTNSYQGTCPITSEAYYK